MNPKEDTNEIQFSSEGNISDKLSSTEKSSKEHLQNQLIKLGDMMGDGLHYEADGKWIAQEYRKVFKALHPEMFQEMRKKKAQSIDEQMKNLLMKSKCSCGGILIQARSGSKVAYCIKCNTRYKANSKKKK